MGWNSVFVINNDAVGEIRGNPEEFVENLLKAMTRPDDKQKTVAAGRTRDAATFITSHSATMTSVCAVGGNDGSVIAIVLADAHKEKADQVTVLQKAARHLGYKLTKA